MQIISATSIVFSCAIVMVVVTLFLTKVAHRTVNISLGFMSRLIDEVQLLLKSFRSTIFIARQLAHEGGMPCFFCLEPHCICVWVFK